MTIIYRCRKCGYVLYIVTTEERHYSYKRYRSYVHHKYIVFKPYPFTRPIGIPTVEEVLRYYNYRCPRCGSELGKKKVIILSSAKD